PGQRALARVVGDRVHLPVGRARTDAPIEAKVGEMPGQAEQMGEVVVGGLLPPSRPDQLEAFRQALQMPCTGGGYVVRHAVDRMQGSWRPVREQRIAGRKSVPFLEPEEADHPVDVQEEKWLLDSIDHKKGVTNVRSEGTVVLSVQTD